MTDQVELPDGTFIDGPLMGSQMPRLWTCPPRHEQIVPGCPACGLEDYEGGCGDYTANECIEWAEAFGYDLDPWQRWSLHNIFGQKPNGKWAAGTNCLIVSRQNGKGTILEVRELAGLFVLGEEFLIHTAHEFKTSVKHFNRLKQTIANYPSLDRRIARIAGSHGEESIELKPQPTIIFGSGNKQMRRKVAPVLAFLARSKGSGRGFSCDCLVYDEDMILSSEQIGASLPTMSARNSVSPHGVQVIYAGSAGDEASEQEGKLRQRIVRNDGKMFGAEWSINPHNDACPRDVANGRKTNYYIVCDKHDDRDDPRSWAKANPAFGYRIELEFTRDEEFLNMPDDEFDKERLGVGQWPAEDAKWAIVSEEKWETLVNEEPGYPEQPMAFAFDIDEDGASATISVAWRHHASSRIVMEIPKNGSRTGSDWVLGKADDMYRKHRPVAIGVPKNGPAGGLIEDAKKLWGDKCVPIGSGEEAAAFAWFMQQVKHDGLWHFGKTKAPTLWYAMGQAEKRVVGDGGFAFSRRDSLADITPVTSAMLAAYVLNVKGRSYDPMKSIG